MDQGPTTNQQTNRVLIVLPTWVGDVVMATPALRALRQLWPSAHITLLGSQNVMTLLHGCAFANELQSYATPSIRPLVRQIKQGGYDTAVLLPGSWRWAVVARLAGIPRRIGYDREARGLLLTDRLLPLRNISSYVPMPAITYYLGIAHFLGAEGVSRQMELPITDDNRANAEMVLGKVALDVAGDRPGRQGKPPWILMNPGAQKLEKRWPAERRAELADRLIDSIGARVLLTGSPAEREVLGGVQRQMRNLPFDLSRAGITLGGLKEIARRCDVMITNDTGPRHIVAALGTPTVALFGPTLPEWTTTFVPHETEVVAHAFSQQGLMSDITVGTVYEATMNWLSEGQPAA